MKALTGGPWGHLRSKREQAEQKDLAEEDKGAEKQEVCLEGRAHWLDQCKVVIMVRPRIAWILETDLGWVECQLIYLVIYSVPSSASVSSPAEGPSQGFPRGLAVRTAASCQMALAQVVWPSAFQL